MSFKQMSACVGLIAISLVAIATPQVQAFDLTKANSSKSVKLFILAGQSNAVGYRSNIADLPSSLQGTQEEVFWYNSQDKWSKLQPPTEPLPFSGGVANGVGFGPEISLGLKISDTLNEPVAIVKYANNGTSLAKEWNPKIPGSTYYKMTDRVKGAIANLSSLGYTADISGFFWMQGESDAKTDLNVAENYEQNFTNFIEQVRTDFEQQNLPFVYGSIPVTNNQTTGFGTFKYGDIVRTAQSNISKTVPFTGTVETIDLPLYNDNLHLSSSGLIELGDRFGDKWLSIRPIPESSTLGFLGLLALIFPLTRTRQKKL